MVKEMGMGESPQNNPLATVTGEVQWLLTSSTRQRAGREGLPVKQRMRDGAWV